MVSRTRSIVDISRRPRRATRLQFERLEQRQLLAADAFSATKPLPEDLLAGGSYHYWADGKKIDLAPIEGQFILGAKAGHDIDMAELLNFALCGEDSYVGDTHLFQDKYLTMDSAAEFDWTQFLAGAETSLELTPQSIWAAPVFRSSENGLRQWVTDEVIVSLEDHVDSQSFFSDSVYASYRPLLGTTDQFVATIAEGGGLEALRLANDVIPQKSGVRWATVNFVSEGQSALIPNDPMFVTQWAHNNFGQSGRNGADGDFAEAWDVQTGDSQVVIAIVDSGVQTDHPDLEMWVNPGEIAGNGVDDDGNGWIDDVNGINTGDGNVNTNNPNPAGPNDNHGTAVAGIAGARGNNSLGVAGGAFGAKIMAIKPWNENADGSFGFSVANLTEAINYLSGRTADGLGTWRGADVSNHSYSVGANSAITDAFNSSTSSGRNGLGVPAFVATGNGASGFQQINVAIDIPFNLFNQGAQVRLRYKKDGSLSAGDDAVWIADVRQPGGIRNQFETFNNFEGWTSSGDAPGVMTGEPSRQFGTGRNTLRMGFGALGNNQFTDLFSPEIETSGTFSFQAWVSSEQDFDGLEVYVAYRTGVFGEFGSFNQAGGLFSGVPDVTSAVGYPANLASVIAVGASSDWDYRSAYSQYGAELDLVAPSGGGDSNVLTTDRTGAAGYGSTDYQAVSGTSFASPLAAASGALLLSRNPELTAAGVRTALINSAEAVGGVTYTGGFNEFYGFGRLDTDLALEVGLGGPDSNNQISEATVVALNTPANGRLGTSRDVDMYRVNVGTGGTTLGFDIDNLAGDNVTDLYLRLFDAFGNELEEDDDTDGPAPEVHGRESYLEFTFTNSNVFFVGVSAFGNQNYNAVNGTGATTASTSGNYQLTVRDLTSQSLIVTQVGDLGNGNVFDGVTLREAITVANQTFASPTIQFDTVGVFSTPQTINLTGSQLTVSRSMTINGANRVAVDAQNNSRVFNIDDGTGSPQNVSLSGMTIRGGNATSGAGLLNRENLTLTEVFFSSNTTTGDGGGIWNAGQLQLTRSALFSNGASRGGGLFQQEGTANVFESTFSGNAASTGGGIANFTGTANIHRSTISENQSGIWSQGNIALTFTNVTGSIVSGNNTEDVVRDGAFFITIASQGFNIVGNGTAISAFGQSTDQVGVNPLLSPLGFNGGPTPAYLLLPGSPAINRGNPNLPSPPVFDQRGTGFSRIIGGVVDVGAVEVNPPVVRTLAAIPNGASTQPGYNLRASEVAFYRFDLGTGVTTANGKSFVIDTFGTSLDGGSDTEIGLYGMLGNLVASDDDGAGSGGISRLSFGAGGVNGDLPAGTYFLAVCGFDTAFGASNFQATSTSSRFGNLVVNFNLAQGSIDPDFNNDGLVNGVDIDLLLANIAIGPANPGTFDLTGDGLVNIGDRDAWLAQAGNINLPSHNPYRLGDANLDGVVDGSDFNLWNSNKFTNNTAWTRGNFNADTAIDGSDFNIWNSNKFTSSLRPAPPSITTTSVPGDDRHPLRRRIGRLESHVDRVFAAYDKEDIAEVT